MMGGKLFCITTLFNSLTVCANNSGLLKTLLYGFFCSLQAGNSNIASAEKIIIFRIPVIVKLLLPAP